MVQACLQAFASTILVSGFLAGAVHQAPNMPNEEISPSRVCKQGDPDHTNYRYKEHIAYCERSVSPGTKSRIYDKYGIPENCRSQFIIDHIIPLSIGGSNAEENLWPEHRDIRDLINPVEEQVFADLSSGSITQQEAIARILEAKFNPKREYNIDLNCR